MIPVFRLKDLQKRPSDPNARARALEIVRKCKDSDEAFRKRCEELGMPYIPCVAADAYGTNYYNGATRRPSQVRLGDIWNR